MRCNFSSDEKIRFSLGCRNETPALTHATKIDSAATEPAALKYHRPQIDMWAETPDYPAINEDGNMTIEDELYVVYDINPEMYAETPDLRAEAAFPTL
jgi:hypothetical protein